MDQTFINFALAGASSVLGWWAREMYTSVKELRADLAALREELPKDYVARDDYREDIREIKEMLQRLFDRLDSKVDKSHG